MAKKTINKKSNTKKASSAKQEIKSSQNSKELATPLKIIGIVSFIISFLIVLIGVASLIAGLSARSLGFDEIQKMMIEKSPPNADLSQLTPEIISFAIIALIIFGCILIILGIVNIFVSRGLLAKKAWARRTTIIFMALLLVFGLTLLSPTLIIISIVIGGYLTFSPQAKEAYKE